MAHFAKIEDGKVVDVLVVDNVDIEDESGNEVEQLGVDFLSDLTGHKEWKQTSYNGSFLKNYAGIGMIYDASLSCFRHEFGDYPSWTLDEDACVWESPTPYPEDGCEVAMSATNDICVNYVWSELTQEWVEKLHEVDPDASTNGE